MSWKCENLCSLAILNDFLILTFHKKKLFSRRELFASFYFISFKQKKTFFSRHFSSLEPLTSFFFALFKFSTRIFLFVHTQNKIMIKCWRACDEIYQSKKFFFHELSVVRQKSRNPFCPQNVRKSCEKHGKKSTQIKFHDFFFPFLLFT